MPLTCWKAVRFADKLGPGIYATEEGIQRAVQITQELWPS
jgi:hypothetical protein